MGTVAGEVGPVEGKLNDFELRGLVFDAFGEASEDVHSLIKYVAEERCAYQKELDGRSRAAHHSDNATIAQLTGQIRRVLSVEGMRSQARLLLDRVSLVGTGVTEAMRRRRNADSEEARMYRERRAAQVYTATGRQVVRSGRFYRT